MCIYFRTRHLTVQRFGCLEVQIGKGKEGEARRRGEEGEGRRRGEEGEGRMERGVRERAVEEGRRERAGEEGRRRGDELKRRERGKDSHNHRQRDMLTTHLTPGSKLCFNMSVG